MTTCKICGEHTLIPDDLEDSGICNLCAQEKVIQLEMENARLAGEVEFVKSQRDEWIRRGCDAESDLQRHKESLEKARVALVKSFDIKTSLPVWFLDAREDALAAINA